MAFKPQLGLLAPVALVAAGLWRTIAAACATLVACAAAATAAFGVNIWGLWLSSLIDYSRTPMINRLMPTVAGSLRLSGAPPSVALAAQTIATVAVAAVVWRACRSGITPRAVALVVVGTFLATPHAMNYDLPMTTFAVVWYLERRLRATQGLFVGEIIVLALALALPAVELSFGDHTPPIAWAPLMALFCLIAIDPYAARVPGIRAGEPDGALAARNVETLLSVDGPV